MHVTYYDINFDNKSYFPIFLSILRRPKENMVLMLVVREKKREKKNKLCVTYCGGVCLNISHA